MRALDASKRQAAGVSVHLPHRPSSSRSPARLAPATTAERQQPPAYETAKSGKAMFDEGIMAEEDIAVLEEIGRLAMECVSLEIDGRPTMKEVAERLKMIRRMKESSAMGAARC
ncbi:hypothetical protein OsJ_34247 [Oryza sativa Japonica Group]|uniref:Uncharacterized protein n=1 Tax=Oryza sativa subsp. japonica TaxID=39947 RepID=B9GB70_ORYSJ|nr:hypothetical protein OsJ_34247 [Oryza sativa Japonica Group]